MAARRATSFSRWERIENGSDCFSRITTFLSSLKIQIIPKIITFIPVPISKGLQLTKVNCYSFYIIIKTVEFYKKKYFTIDCYFFCVIYVFLDEVQKIFPIINPALTEGKHIPAKKDDEQIISFVDVILGLSREKNIDLYVTGSNSKMLSSDIITEFRDKAVNIQLLMNYAI